MVHLSPPRSRRSWLLLAALALPASALLAGSPTPDDNKSVTQSIMDTVTPLNTLDVESAYVGGGSFQIKRYNGAGAMSQASYGRMDGEIDSSIEYGHRFPLFGNVYLKLGFDYERLDFGTTQAPLPTTLENASGVVALEYIVQGNVGAFITSKPGVYFSDDKNVNWKSVDAPTSIGGIVPLNKEFYLLLGAHFSVLEKFPVFPIVGVVWLVSDDLRVMAIPPEPRVVYTINKHLEAFAGGEILGAGYKRDYTNYRPQDQRFSGGVIDYSEYRAGAGLTFKPCKALDIDVSGGWSFDRDFDYYRGDSRRFILYGAPYAKLAFSAEF